MIDTGRTEPFQARLHHRHHVAKLLALLVLPSSRPSADAAITETSPTRHPLFNVGTSTG